MVFAYSPHRESGATLHIPSPTNSPHSDQNPALAQLRRSLSRSPSRGPAFRLVTSKSSSPTLNSPLSPSPLTPSRRSNTWGTDTTATSHDLKPLASPFLPNSKRKHRAGVRHLSPMRPTGRSLGIQRSPVRRILADSSDHGNAISFQSTSSGEGAENEGQTCEIGSEKMEISEPTAPHSAQERDNYLAPRHAINRRERPNGYFDIVKSSPLKRSEGSTNLDLASFGTPAKRRSLHGAPFGPDFNIFDYGLTSEKPNLATQAGEGATGINADQDSPNSFTPMPYRSSSLRRTTLQQRLDKPSMGKIRPSMDNLFDSRTPNSSETKARNRLSLDFPVPQVSRESPFSNENLPSASIHPAPLRRQETSESRTLQVSSRHPLARTISQSSSSSGLAQDSPTHVPIRHPDAHRTRGDHSWSLPFGSTRPMLHDVRTTNSSSEQSSFATPDNYKLAKPLPAAFMSTGLISKRNRNIDNESLEVGESVGNMPDTPCKRPTSLTSIPPQPTPDINLHKAKQARHTMHSFGTPSTPFNLQVSTAVGNGNTKSFPVFGSSFNSQASRRGSFTTPDDAEDALRSPLAIFQNKHNKSFDLPPTPTKQALDPGNSPSSNFRSPVSPSIHSVRREENVIRSPEIAVNCKSIFVSTPDAARGGGKSGSQSSPSSNVLRFRSLNSISSFSKRPQGYSRSHCPTPILKNSPSPSVSSKRTQNAKKTLPTASPVLERRDCTSPHTPLDAMAPPDPSGLSISAQGDKTVAAGYQIVNARSSFGMPATPTAPRDSFGRSSRFGSSLTPVHHSVPPEVDASITSKFDKVEPFNTGEFSQVFRVSSRSNQVNRQASFNSPFGKQSPGSTFSEQVWAVKKATKPYIGRRDRQRKLQEVEILKALGHADHTINYMDSWEYKDHLYIQTEFCEEGTLESFLEKAGQNARLDDFRIWKIMLELSLVRLSCIVSSFRANSLFRASGIFTILASYTWISNLPIF